MANRGRQITPKTQRKISEDLVTPYVNPDTGETAGNPNGNVPKIQDRGNQLSFRDDNTKPFSIGIKDLDETIVYYFKNVIKPYVIQNGQRINVPIIYGNSERWNQISKDGYYRDKKNKIMMPLIVFKRSNLTKDRTLTNKLDSNNPNFNVAVYSKLYSKKNAYDNFSVLNNRKPTIDTYAVVVPDYVTLTYDCIVSTYYVEQMNGIIEAINYASDSYWGNPERFKFRARIDSYATNVELPAGSERVVKSTFQIRLRGYIIPEVYQNDVTAIKKLQTTSQVKIFNESVENIGDYPLNQPTNIQNRTTIPYNSIFDSEDPIAT